MQTACEASLAGIWVQAAILLAKRPEVRSAPDAGMVAELRRSIRRLSPQWAVKARDATTATFGAQSTGVARCPQTQLCVRLRRRHGQHESLFGSCMPFRFFVPLLEESSPVDAIVAFCAYCVERLRLGARWRDASCSGDVGVSSDMRHSPHTLLHGGPRAFRSCA